MGGSALRGGRGGGSGGVDSEEFLRLEIKCCRYLSLKAKCAHVLSALFLSTPGMTRRTL